MQRGYEAGERRRGPWHVRAEREFDASERQPRRRPTWQSMVRQLLSTPGGVRRLDMAEFNRVAAFDVFGEEGIEALRRANPDHHLVRVYDGEIPLDSVPADD
jgi:hypothetical protein